MKLLLKEANLHTYSYNLASNIDKYAASIDIKACMTLAALPGVDPLCFKGEVCINI